MADAVPQVKLSGGIHGATTEGALTPVSWLFNLENQDVHLQLSVCVEPSDVNKLIALPNGMGPSGAGQTMFVLKPSEDVQIRLNGVAELVWNISGGAPFVIAGSPEVTQIEFSGVSSNVCRVFITKIMDTTALPLPPGAPTVPGVGLYTVFENIGPATNGQTSFTLSAIPGAADRLVLIVDGVWYTHLNSFMTVAGTTVTWLPAAPGGYTFTGGERVEALY